MWRCSETPPGSITRRVDLTVQGGPGPIAVLRRRGNGLEAELVVGRASLEALDEGVLERVYCCARYSRLSHRVGLLIGLLLTPIATYIQIHGRDLLPLGAEVLLSLVVVGLFLYLSIASYARDLRQARCASSIPPGATLLNPPPRLLVRVSLELARLCARCREWSCEEERVVLGWRYRLRCRSRLGVRGSAVLQANM